jgi:signal transduction histidine kinase
VRRQKSNPQLLSLNLLVQEVLALSRQPFELDQVRLIDELAEGLPQLNLHPGQLQQVLLALLQNSREAIQRTGQAGEIKVQTSQQGAWVRLLVEDNGPGIPEQIQERIFEPFFTTKEVGKGAGAGMGLSLCFASARELGGRLWAEPRAAGACMVLELPVEASAGEATAKEAMPHTR